FPNFAQSLPLREGTVYETAAQPPVRVSNENPRKENNTKKGEEKKEEEKTRKPQINWRQPLKLPADPPNPGGKEADENQLLDAAGRGELDKVKALLAKGTSTAWKNKLGQSAVHWAAGHGHVESLRALLDSKAEVNALTSKNWTPLHYASYNGNYPQITL